MKIIDIAIPSRTAETPTPERPRLPPASSNVFISRANVEEYVLADNDDEKIYADPGDEDDEAIVDKPKEEFFEAVETTTETQKQDLQQVTFEFDFNVGDLKASLLKAGSDGVEQLLAKTSLQGFGLTFRSRKWDMSVDIYLKALLLDMINSNLKDGRCITSGTQTGERKDLVRIKYLRVQKDSPEFMTVHDGVDQSIEAALSTITVHVEPEPILSLYGFIMTTFVPEHSQEDAATTATIESGYEVIAPQPASSDRIRVRVKLTSIQREYVALSIPAARLTRPLLL